MTTVLVTGPESSGNRMLCRMLTEAGAAVLHKPMPMSTHWRPGTPGDPDNWDGLWTDFSTIEWDAAVVIIRDPVCAVASQVKQGHARDADHAATRTRQALVNIYGQLAQTTKPWWTVTYEGLARPEAAEALCRLLRLPGRPVTRWQDANAKHYGGRSWADHSRLHERPRAG